MLNRTEKRDIRDQDKLWPDGKSVYCPVSGAGLLFLMVKNGEITKNDTFFKYHFKVFVNESRARLYGDAITHWCDTISYMEDQGEYLSMQMAPEARRAAK